MCHSNLFTKYDTLYIWGRLYNTRLELAEIVFKGMIDPLNDSSGTSLTHHIVQWLQWKLWSSSRASKAFMPIEYAYKFFIWISINQLDKVTDMLTI